MEPNGRGLPHPGSWQQKASQALNAIDIRRACGYPHLGSSRDSWNNTPTTITTIQNEINSLRQDLDQKFTILTNLLTNPRPNPRPPYTGTTYAEALIRNTIEQLSLDTQNTARPSPTGTTGKKRQFHNLKQPQKETTSGTNPLDAPSFHERRIIIQPKPQIDPSAWRSIQHQDTVHQSEAPGGGQGG